MVSGARNLHRIAGAVDRLKHEAATGTCALPSCNQPSVGYIMGWDLRPRGCCAEHVPGATERGYVVHPDPRADA